MNIRGRSLELLGARVADIEDRLLSRDDALRKIKRRMAFVPSPYRSRLNRARLSWGAGIAAAVALLVWMLLSPGDLTVRAEGRRLKEGDWISSNGDHPTALRFSDGSRVVLQSKTGVRVRALSAAGAHLLLERGTVSVEVSRGPDTDWRFDVGPYSLWVTGTRFSVSWDPEPEAIDIDMQEGSLEVTGPMISKGKPLVAGERLEASLKTGRMTFSSGAAVPGDSSAAVGHIMKPSPPPPPAVPVPGGEERPASQVRKATSVPKRSGGTWQQLAATGQYAEAIAHARRSGMDAILAQAPAPTLITLGDAARYAGETALAERVYRRVRRRYPASSQASVAAFALGVMAFDKKGAFREAAGWFGAIVAETSGRGSLAREASGRLIEALNRAGDEAGARRAASRYLERYPEGPHAGLAKRLTP
jgi:transmembrane sensor